LLHPHHYPLSHLILLCTCIHHNVSNFNKK
jgi:hypothetical protein